MSEAPGEMPKIEKPSNHNAVLTPHEYLRDVRLEARHAKKSVVIKTMLLDEGRMMDSLIDAFNQAPPGVEKKLIIDWYALLVVDVNKIEALTKKPPSHGPKMSEAKKRRLLLISKLKEHGIKVEFTRRPESWKEHVVPWLKRDHIKIAAIDADTDDAKVYVGGVNINRSDDYVDFMVKYTGTVARSIYTALQELDAQRIKHDTQKQLDEHTRLLIDVGAPRESLILDEAVKMVEEAGSSVEHISMSFPDGPMKKALSQIAHPTDTKKKPVRAEVLVSSQELRKGRLSTGHVYDAIRATMLRSLARAGVTILSIPSFVHGKLLMVDRNIPGKRKAYFGAHNLTTFSVNMKMQEWGIITTDPELIVNLGKFYDQSKGGPKVGVE